MPLLPKIRSGAARAPGPFLPKQDRRCSPSIRTFQLHGAMARPTIVAVRKRLLAYEALFGSTREHLRRYGSLISKPEIAAEGLLVATG